MALKPYNQCIFYTPAHHNNRNKHDLLFDESDCNNFFLSSILGIINFELLLRDDDTLWIKYEWLGDIDGVRDRCIQVITKLSVLSFIRKLKNVPCTCKLMETLSLFSNKFLSYFYLSISSFPSFALTIFRPSLSPPRTSPSLSSLRSLATREQFGYIRWNIKYYSIKIHKTNVKTWWNWESNFHTMQSHIAQHKIIQKFSAHVKVIFMCSKSVSCRENPSTFLIRLVHVGVILSAL